MPLTWRNVEAPDFSSAQQGFTNFTNLLDRAFSGASQALGKYDGELDKNANNAFAMRLLQFTDPAAYAKAQADGSLFAGVPTDRLSAASLAAAGAREDALLSTANNQLTLDKGQYQFGQEKSRDSAELAATPLLAGLQAAQEQGKGAEYMAAHPELTNGALGFNRINQLVTSGLTNEQGRVNITGMRDTQNQNAWRFNNEKEEFAANKQFDTNLAQLNSLGDPQAAIKQINTLFAQGKLDPRVYNRLSEQFTAQADAFAGGSVPGAGGGAGGGNAAVGDGSRVMNYEARASGFGSVPQSVQTMGQASDFALTVNAANKARTGKPGSSAMGTYQIVGDTMRNYAPKVLGADWRNQAFTAENQEKIAKQVFLDNRGSADALRKQWVSLTPAEAERVRKLPWEQARAVIAQGESGVNPNDLAYGQALVGNAVAQADMARNADNNYSELSKAAQNNASIASIAAAETKSGRFTGMSQVQIAQNIQNIQNRVRQSNGGKGPTINAATAAEIMAQSVRGQDTWFGLGEGKMAIDDKALTTAINDYASGGQQKYVAAETQSKLNQGDVATAADAYQKAQARYAYAQRRVDQGYKVPNLEQLKTEAVTASRAYQAAQNNLSKQPGTTAWITDQQGKPAPVNRTPNVPGITRPKPQGLVDPIDPTKSPQRIISDGIRLGQQFNIPRSSGESDEKYAIRATNTARAIQRQREQAAQAAAAAAAARRRETFFSR